MNNASSKTNELYRKFVQRFGSDESVKKIFENMIIKARKIKAERIDAKLGDNK